MSNRITETSIEVTAISLLETYTVSRQIGAGRIKSAAITALSNTVINKSTWASLTIRRGGIQDSQIVAVLCSGYPSASEQPNFNGDFVVGVDDYLVMQIFSAVQPMLVRGTIRTEVV